MLYRHRRGCGGDVSPECVEVMRDRLSFEGRQVELDGVRELARCGGGRIREELVVSQVLERELDRLGVGRWRRPWGIEWREQLSAELWRDERDLRFVQRGCIPYL